MDNLKLSKHVVLFKDRKTVKFRWKRTFGASIGASYIGEGRNVSEC